MGQAPIGVAPLATKVKTVANQPGARESRETAFLAAGLEDPDESKSLAAGESLADGV